MDHGRDSSPTLMGHDLAPDGLARQGRLSRGDTTKAADRADAASAERDAVAGQQPEPADSDWEQRGGAGVAGPAAAAGSLVAGGRPAGAPAAEADHGVFARPAVQALPRRRVGYRGRLLLTIATGKATVLLVVFLAYNLLPFFTANFDVNFVNPTYRGAGIARAFSTWDAQHYLYLSEHGYHAGQESDAFFPLFPLLIHLATPLFHSSLVAGLVVANVASLIGLYFLFELVAALYGRPAARGTLLLYLAFPTAFFLSLVYSESLFLLLAALFFYLLLVKRRMAWAAVPAALLPLARAEGTLILLPFAVYYLVEEALPGLVSGSGFSLRGLSRPASRFSLRATLVLSPLLGVAAYLSFMWLATGDPFEMFKAMNVFVSAHSLAYLLHPTTLLGLLFEHPLAIHGFTNSIIDRAMFIGFLALLVPLFRRVHISLAVFALAVGLLNVVSGTFMSYSRYLLLAFPIFFAAAMLLRGREVRWLRPPILYSLVMLQGLLLTMHALGYWVA